MCIDKIKIRKEEIDELLEKIWQKYGYDFRNYARASLERRISYRLSTSGLKSISEMTFKIINDMDFFENFLNDMSITVTEMFRNPFVFKKIVNEVFPHLKTYHRINIWHAGCATGEEVYSLAILLEENQLLEKCQIYATDYNNKSLYICNEGIYPLEKMKEYSENYILSGGKKSFSDYYHANYESAIFKNSLKDNICFAHHNLMRDVSFAEMNIVICRNVMIYFDRKLQNQVLNLFNDSLINRGFLILGDKETLSFTEVESKYEEFAKKEKIYRKKLEAML